MDAKYGTALIAVAVGMSVLAGAEKPIDFQREIRPILSENCFSCHGPDATSRMAGLRLDLKATAFRVIAP